ncbi:MAG: PD-(D/E)XK nuclease family protein [Ignavibacteriales bacterium]|nr:PD-(D/E)XK nuclease family protein [Ignavibacteriales bacterium]
MREVPVPDLDEEEYRKLFAGDRSVSVEDLEPRYRAARVIERNWDRPEVSATAVKEAWRELEAARGAGTDEAGEELPALDFDRFAQEVPETAFGELCHAAVQALLDPSADGAEAFEASLAALPEARRDALAGQARRLAASFLGLGPGQGCGGRPGGGGTQDGGAVPVRPGRDAGAEPGPGVPAVPVISGRMDLCFRAGDRVEVVDFKSDRRRREGEYDGQLAAYRAACRELHPGLEVRTWLFWLRAARAEERPPAAGEAAFLAEAAAPGRRHFIRATRTVIRPVRGSQATERAQTLPAVQRVSEAARAQAQAAGTPDQGPPRARSSSRVNDTVTDRDGLGSRGTRAGAR